MRGVDERGEINCRKRKAWSYSGQRRRHRNCSKMRQLVGEERTGNVELNEERKKRRHLTPH